MSGLSDGVAEAMDNKRYDEAAEGLAQMNRLTCIDNIVVDRLLEGARNEVKTADSYLTLLTSPTPRTHALLRSRGLHATQRPPFLLLTPRSNFAASTRR